MKCPDCGTANIDGSDQCDSCHAPLTVVAPKPGMERRILEGTIADLSPKAALSVGPADSLAKAIETMRGAKVGCVMVVEGGALVGVLSERELLMRASQETDFKGVLVRDIMRANPTILREDDQVADIFNRMAMSGHRHVPIRLKDGSYGVVSARDLLSYLCK